MSCVAFGFCVSLFSYVWTLSQSFLDVTLTLWKIWVSYFAAVPLFELVWCLIMTRYRLCRSLKMWCCVLLIASVRWCTISIWPITDDVSLTSWLSWCLPVSPMIKFLTTLPWCYRDALLALLWHQAKLQCEPPSTWLRLWPTCSGHPIPHPFYLMALWLNHSERGRREMGRERAFLQFSKLTMVINSNNH